jgi:hypothetical protein
MGKKNRRRVSLMKDWPSDESCGIPYEDLLHPLKRIVYEGYELKRKPLMQFAYAGYNIGKADRLYHPTPDERFSNRWLENESKFNRTLMDNILMTALQLGMEQARRKEYTAKYTNALLEDIVKAQTNKIKELKAQLAQYDVNFAEDNIPMEHEGNDLIIEDVEVLPSNVDA